MQKCIEISKYLHAYNSPIVLKFCTEHDSHISMLSLKFQNDLVTEK